MSITTLIAMIAGIIFIVFGIWYAVGGRFLKKQVWIFPAILSILFLGLSLYAIATEGPFGFWTEHTRNFWGVQIWLDLLLGVGIGWFLVVPQAKPLGMRPLPWLLLIICTGCIGFTAMIARLLYLRENA